MLFHHFLVLASLGRLDHKYWDILRSLRNIGKKNLRNIQKIITH